MFTLISTMNDWGQRWLTVMWAVIWQLALVVVVATATARLRPAQGFRLYWTAGGLASAATLSAALVW